MLEIFKLIKQIKTHSVHMRVKDRRKKPGVDEVVKWYSKMLSNENILLWIRIGFMWLALNEVKCVKISTKKYSQNFEFI